MSKNPGAKYGVVMHGNKPVSPAQQAAIEKAERKAQAEALARTEAQRLAQIVNLQIAGYSLADIGAQIGASADEVDRLLQRDAQRYVRNQPALRVYVRNWISARYSAMLEADWEEASDKSSPKKLETQDRVMRILDRMAKLHGADAPVQTEVKVDAAPEAVEKLVQVLAAQSGHGYDASVFDIVDAEVVHEMADEQAAALEVSGNMVGETTGDEDPEEAL
jgi:hypothetical protein